MRRKIAGTILLMTSLLYSVAGAVYARTDSTAEVHNYIETGDINIDLKQYQPNGEEFKAGQIWIPGDRIADVIQIENQAKECWVRVMEHHDEVISIGGVSERWVFREPYWYYTETMKEDEAVIFAEELSFSPNATEETGGKNDCIEITAEAVQAANFAPDFQGESPWGDQEAELCVHVKADEKERIRSYRELTLLMEGYAGRLVAAPEDFFSNLSELMPGDTKSDEIIIHNVFNKEAELFFRTEDEPDMTAEQKELLEKLQLSIYNNGKLIYEGDLRSVILNQEISLGTWKSGEKGRLTYSIFMPEELKNAFAVRDAGVCWIFRTNIKETPKTGDSDMSGHYLILSVISGMIGAWILLKKRKNNNQKVLKHI